jgi:hypothetical protein
MLLPGPSAWAILFRMSRTPTWYPATILIPKNSITASTAIGQRFIKHPLKPDIVAAVILAGNRSTATALPADRMTGTAWWV